MFKLDFDHVIGQTYPNFYNDLISLFILINFS